MADETVASLGFEVNSSGLDQATAKLKGLSTEATNTTKTVDGLNKSFDGIGAGNKNPFDAMTKGIADAHKEVAKTPSLVKGMGDSINQALSKGAGSFPEMTKGIKDANTAFTTLNPQVSQHANVVNEAAKSHAGLSTQSMAAGHSLRSMVEVIASGGSPIQAMTQQIGHLSYAASGPGGITEAFAGIARMIGTGGLIGGAIAATIGAFGLLSEKMASTAQETEKAKARLEALGGAKLGGEYSQQLEQLTKDLGLARDKAQPTYEALLKLVSLNDRGGASGVNVIGWGLPEQFDKTKFSADKATDSIKAVFQALKLSGSSTEEATTATGKFFDELTKKQKLTGDGLRELEKESPQFANALTQALTKSGQLTEEQNKKLRELAQTAPAAARELRSAFDRGALSAEQYAHILDELPVSVQKVIGVLPGLKQASDGAFKSLEDNPRTAGEAIDKLSKKLGGLWDELSGHDRAADGANQIGIFTKAVSALADAVEKATPAISAQVDQEINDFKALYNYIAKLNDDSSVQLKAFQDNVIKYLNPKEGVGIFKEEMGQVNTFLAEWEQTAIASLKRVTSEAMSAAKSVAASIASMFSGKAFEGGAGGTGETDAMGNSIGNATASGSIGSGGGPDINNGKGGIGSDGARSGSGSAATSAGSSSNPTAVRIVGWEPTGGASSGSGGGSGSGGRGAPASGSGSFMGYPSINAYMQAVATGGTAASASSVNQRQTSGIYGSGPFSPLQNGQNGKDPIKPLDDIKKGTDKTNDNIDKTNQNLKPLSGIEQGTDKTNTHLDTSNQHLGDIKATGDSTVSAVTSTQSAVSEGSANTVSSVDGASKDITSSFGSDIKSMTDTLSQVFSSVGASIKSGLSSLGGAIGSAGANSNYAAATGSGGYGDSTSYGSGSGGATSYGTGGDYSPGSTGSDTVGTGNSGGGNFGASAGNTGGYTGGADVPQFASGGHVSGMGTGTSDSVPAMLSHGEFVHNADAVKHYGAEFMHAINKKQLRKFSDGGPVTLGEAFGSSGNPGASADLISAHFAKSIKDQTSSINQSLDKQTRILKSAIEGSEDKVISAVGAISSALNALQKQQTKSSASAPSAISSASSKSSSSGSSATNNTLNSRGSDGYYLANDTSPEAQVFKMQYGAAIAEGGWAKYPQYFGGSQNPDAWMYYMNIPGIKGHFGGFSSGSSSSSARSTPVGQQNNGPAVDYGVTQGTNSSGFSTVAFATGGGFTVGGKGGTDSTPVSFMATPGEHVDVYHGERSDKAGGGSDKIVSAIYGLGRSIEGMSRNTNGVAAPTGVAVSPALLNPAAASNVVDMASRKDQQSTNKNVHIVVQAGVQADQFIRSRAEIQRAMR